jgi:hypothetical protein
MFCAAVPLVAAAGVKLNNKQLTAERQARIAGSERPATWPVMQIAASVVLLLLSGSVAYHTMTSLP